MAKVWLGPYRWGQFGWSPPAGVVGGIDLAAPMSLPAPGVDRPGGLFVTANPANLGSDYFLVGQATRPQDIATTPLIRDAFLDQVGYRPAGGNVALLIADCLMNGADPDGLVTCKPLVPVSGLDLEVWLAGARFDIGKFSWGQHAYTNRLKDLIQRDFRNIFNAVQAGQLPIGHYRKVLGYLCRRYGLSRTDISQWREFVPADLWNDVEAPVEPTTTISDNFNRANESLDAGSWVEVSGNWSVTSNRAMVSPGGAVVRARHTTALSSSDNYSQADIDSDTSGQYNGTYCRANNSDLAAYASEVSWLEDTIDLLSVNGAGSATLLGTVGQTAIPGTPITLKLQANGSTIKLFLGITEKVSVTNTAVSSGTYVAMWGYATSSFHDNFEAADLGAGAQTISPTAVASTLAFGTLKVNPKIYPAASASTLAVGSPSLADIIYPASRASSLQVGNPQLNPTIYPTARESSLAFGTAKLNPTIFPSSKGSGLVIGSPSLVSGDTVAPDGVASTLAFGTVKLNPTIFPASKASGLTFGVVLLVTAIYPGSVASTLTIGQPSLGLIIRLASRASTLQIGTVQLNLTIYPATRGSTLTFGTLTIYDPNNILVLEPPFTVVTAEAVLTIVTPDLERSVTTPVVVRSVFTPPRG